MIDVFKRIQHISRGIIVLVRHVCVVAQCSRRTLERDSLISHVLTRHAVIHPASESSIPIDSCLLALRNAGSAKERISGYKSQDLGFRVHVLQVCLSVT